MDVKSKVGQEGCSGRSSTDVSKEEVALIHGEEQKNEELEEANNKDEKKNSGDSKDNDNEKDRGDKIDDDKDNENALGDENTRGDKCTHGDKINDENMDDFAEDEDTDEAEVKILETLLVQNPYDYSSHVALIKKFETMGELERLRAARENMSSKYPLSSDLWLAWIRDEIRLSVSANEKADVIKLCGRAVKDYLCKL